MPRYFFDVAEGRKGVRRAAHAEFADEDMARAYALGLAETLMQNDEVPESGLKLVIISDESGQVIEVVQPETQGMQGKNAG